MESGDRKLMERISAGDDLALAAVYDLYGASVFGVASRLVGPSHAIDVCQEVFVSLWDHPDRFDPERGSLRALLVTITRRRCIDHLRRAGRRSANEERALHARTSVQHDVDDLALAHLSSSRVRDALAVLPEAQRIAITLAYFDGLTFREVARVTGVSEGTAKSRIRLALQRLAAVLGPHEKIGTS